MGKWDNRPLATIGSEDGSKNAESRRSWAIALPVQPPITAPSAAPNVGISMSISTNFKSLTKNSNVWLLAKRRNMITNLAGFSPYSAARTRETRSPWWGFRSLDE